MPPVGRFAGSVPSLGSTTARWRIGCTAQASYFGAVVHGGTMSIRTTFWICAIGACPWPRSQLRWESVLRGFGPGTNRTRPADRADRSARVAPSQMVPWRRVLANALSDRDVIGVRATVISHLGQQPTRTQSTAARRAAHRLVAADLAHAVHVPVRAGDMLREVNHLVLVRSGVTPGNDQLLDAAIWRPPAPDQLARGLELSLTALGVAARNMNVDQLSAEQARCLAAILRDSVAGLSRLAGQLERRAKRS